MTSRYDDLVSQMHEYYRNDHSLLETGRRFHRSMQDVWQLFKRRGLWMREAHKKIKRKELNHDI